MVDVGGDERGGNGAGDPLRGPATGALAGAAELLPLQRGAHEALPVVVYGRHLPLSAARGAGNPSSRHVGRGGEFEGLPAAGTTDLVSQMDWQEMRASFSRKWGSRFRVWGTKENKGDLGDKAEKWVDLSKV
ncbi:hypothetical protein B296_00035361 [Ensete ventricosum]|uniref:Uncharacterized protein n=1 Tax=Ensete ventricosum TaxID=4639 RepID=A0A426ZZM7_ENSVE|nr:hypothetical protein B296_00035361 [Ensete ventricosum]